MKEAELVIKDHVARQSCLLGRKQGFYVPETENPLLTGLSLPGAVSEVRNNQLKLRLDIDACREQECWFVYSTFYSMFYCMPEKGDRINLYFPDPMEAHAFALNSVSTNPLEAAAAEKAAQKDYDFQSMAQNEKVKVLCTKGGKMVILDDDRGNVSVVCGNGTYIALEEQGISIITDERIGFIATGGVKIKAGAELFLSADNSIQLVCKESLIGLTPELIAVKGANIKLNED